MINKEQNPDVFKNRSEAFKKAYRNDPNHGFKPGYKPTEAQMRAHGWTPENGWGDQDNTKTTY
jgi:hypothetical protein